MILQLIKRNKIKHENWISFNNKNAYTFYQFPNERFRINLDYRGNPTLKSVTIKLIYIVNEKGIIKEYFTNKVFNNLNNNQEPGIYIEPNITNKTLWKIELEPSEKFNKKLRLWMYTKDDL